MKSHSNKITIYFKDRLLEVEYDYSYSEGRYYMSNGDPGYPEESDLEINEVFDKNGNKYDHILDRYDKKYPDTNIWTKLIDEVYLNMEEEDNF